MMRIFVGKCGSVDSAVRVGESIKKPPKGGLLMKDGMRCVRQLPLRLRVFIDWMAGLVATLA